MPTLFDESKKFFLPENDSVNNDVPLVKLEEQILSILVNIPGDHPMLITIDLEKRRYDVEGYD